MNKVQAAKCFRVSTNTLSEWVRKGCPCEKKGRNGEEYTFDLPGMIAWRVEQLLDQRLGPLLTGNDLRDAEKREAFAKAALRELELEEKQKTLVNTLATARVFLRGIMEVRSQLLALPTKLAPRLIAFKKVAQMKLMLERAIHNALTGLSHIQFPEDALEEHLAPVGPAADADAQPVGRSKTPAQPRKQRRNRPVGNVTG